MTPLRKPVSRKTTTELGGQFGPDRGRPMVVTLTPNPGGDLLGIRPLGTRREESVRLEDVYQWIIRFRAANAQLDRARAVRARKLEREHAQAERRRVAALKRAAFNSAGKDNT